MLFAHSGLSSTKNLPLPEVVFAWAAAAVLVISFAALAVLGFRRNYRMFNFRRDRRGRRVSNPSTWEVGAPVFFRPSRSPDRDDDGR